MILNSLFPVIALIVLGRILQTTGFIKEDFIKTSDRLVYYIFFPCMLFWKIAGSRSPQGIDMALPIAAICAVVLIFILSTLYIIFGRVTSFEAGTFSQSSYRFNSYIGMAIIVNALGDEGIIHFGILIGFAIPIINFLSVIILIWFSGQKYEFTERGKRLLKAIVSNPLIIACFSGVLFSNTEFEFPVFIVNTLELFSMVTLPLALISIGSAFSISELKGYLRLSVISSIFKLIMLPAAGVFFMIFFNVGTISFQVGLIYFCLPTSPALYLLSSQMNSDTDLASATIVFSTLISIIPLSIVLLQF